MRLDTVLAGEAGRATGPDLSRYLVVCAALIVGMLALAWLFRRTVGGRLKARAAKRSLQVLDVLPLSGKQKLVVVRCYDRSFLLGTGEKEVRVLAELDGVLDPAASTGPAFEVEPRPRGVARSFGTTLEGELAQRPVPAVLDPKGGVLA